MIEAEFILGSFEAGLDGPTRDGSQFGKRRAGRREHDVVGERIGIVAAAANHKPVLPACVRQPQQPPPRPVVQPRAFGALAGGMAGLGVSRERSGQLPIRGQFKRIAADPLGTLLRTAST